MRPNFQVVLLFIVSIAGVAFAQAPEPDEAHRILAADAKSVLLQTDADFNRATQERRLEGWMEYMADNVVLQRGAVGKEAVRKELTAEWAEPKYNLTWKPDGAQMFDSNTFGFTWGHWELQAPKKDGTLLHMTGQYLTVWQKQKDGSWKVVWDGGSASPQSRAEAANKK